MYSGKLKTPKWKNFKGIQVGRKDKIRLNNLIWREWHMQCNDVLMSRLEDFLVHLILLSLNIFSECVIIKHLITFVSCTIYSVYKPRIFGQILTLKVVSAYVWIIVFNKVSIKSKYAEYNLEVKFV